MPYLKDVNPESSTGREAIVRAGKAKGLSAASTDYPYAVYREPQGAMKAAEYAFAAWINSDVVNLSSEKEEWARVRPTRESEMKRLFTSTFAGAYLEKVAEQDKKEGRSSGVQTASLATMQGATVVLKGVDRSKPNEYVYSLELSDPEHFDGVEKTEWVVYFEGASVPSTAAAAATASYAMSGSDVAYAYGSSTPQKSVKKPKGSYLRSPK
jgi:hypothetical protein